jgi:hypothetical protein
MPVADLPVCVEAPRLWLAHAGRTGVGWAVLALAVFAVPAEALAAIGDAELASLFAGREVTVCATFVPALGALRMGATIRFALRRLAAAVVTTRDGQRNGEP